MTTIQTSVLVSLALLSALLHSSLAFVPPQSHRAFSRKCVQIHAAGMGMASSSKKKKGAASKKKKKGKSSFDVSKSMLKSEKLYDELLKEATKALDEDHPQFGVTMTTEYIIAARLNPDVEKSSVPGASSISDWVPVAQLCLARPIDHGSNDHSAVEKERLSRAISLYCREINYVATLGSSLFKSIPRNLIQYSAEDIDSFYKFVYEDVIEGKNNDADNEDVMTKAEARTVLKLSEDCNDLAEIKKAYRKLSMQYHPDRFVGIERTKEEEDKSNDAFAKVKIAYESLNSGIRTSYDGDKKVKSWYESLGGRARTDFIGPIDLVSVDVAKEELSRRDNQCALAGLVPETVMAFVTRNQMAA